jgi:hypothetical protein
LYPPPPAHQHTTSSSPPNHPGAQVWFDASAHCGSSQLQTFGWTVDASDVTCGGGYVAFWHGGGGDSCGDTNSGAADSRGEPCTTYNTWAGTAYDHCATGWFDDADFSAGQMCCGCGGGAGQGSVSIPLPSGFAMFTVEYGQSCYSSDARVVVKLDGVEVERALDPSDLRSISVDLNFSRL